ncbi:MAG: hypothetical protein ABIT08_10585 [Bacteroidia bacterium]
MNKRTRRLKTVIALFLAVAVINIYVTDSYCSFTKEIGHPHADLALIEAREKHYHSQADGAGKSAEHHHKSLKAEKPHHHHGDQIKSSHHHEGNETETPEEYHTEGQKPGKNCHDASQAECDNHHDGKKDDNCCKDNSESFFSALINHSVTFPVLKNIFTGIINCFYSNNELLTLSKFSTKGFVIREAPPPKTSGVRILIRSFII